MATSDFWDDGPASGGLGPLPRLLYTLKEAAAILSIGRSKLYELLSSGELKSLLIGRARRIEAAAIEEFIEARRAAADEKDDRS